MKIPEKIPFRIFCTRIGLFLLILKAASAGYSQVLPENRRTDWNVAGTEYEQQAAEKVLNILDFGGAADSLTDNTSALQNAMEELSGQAGIIYFPEGVYLFHSSISLTDSILIKGHSPEKTQLLFDLQQQANHCFNISHSQNTEFTRIVSGYERNSVKIKVENPNEFTVGGYAEIRQENGLWDTNPVSWAEHSVGQIVKIVNISGDHLILKNPLRIDFLSELNPEIRPVQMIRNTGFECFKLSRIDQPETGAGSNFYFSYAVNCRMIGVESDKSVGSHVYLTNSSNIAVKGCYIHDAFTFDGVGTRGYGLTLNMHTGECLIENNIFRKLRHAMMVKTGANGNVFAYNYSTEPYRSEAIHDLTGDISLHGHYAYANLFEGNIVQNIIIDHYWGPAGPLNTFFRNRAELYGFIITNTDSILTGMQNIIGNETTNESNFFGNYVVHGSDHFEYSNNIKGAIIPAGTEELPDSSYYLDETPLFWCINDPWPSVGYPHTPGQYSNPAEMRYITGENFCICSDDIFTAVQPANVEDKNSVYPNPSKGLIHFATGSIEEVKLYNTAGILLGEYSINGNSFRIPASIPDGMLIVKTRSRKNIHVTKILLCR